jgi:multidrug resistance protein MdtO
MATAAQNVSARPSPLAWFGEFLKDELAPYSGRAALVGRMTLAATLIMIIGMTFRIPYSWQGAVYALLVSRENTRATLQSAATIFFVTGIGAAYLLLSVWFVINVPLLHFVWIIGTLFLAFYAVSALTDYTAAVAFINLIAACIPLWDRHVPAETNVEDTLWLCLAVSVAVVVTGAVELAFVRHRPGDQIVSPITERLTAVEDFLTWYAEGRTADPGIAKKIVRLEMVGTSMLRRILRRSDYSRQYSAEMGGVAVLVGRLIDLAATLSQFSFELSISDPTRFRNLAGTLATFRDDLMNGRIPAPIQFSSDGQPATLVPLLGEMEYTASLIPQAFADSRLHQQYLPPADDTRRRTVLVPDAFVNPEHIQFALKGCLAAGSCYVIYNAIAWPGINTAVTTCLLTALSTIGASRQKQVLRIAGAVVGGFVIGMGSQVFVLPYIDFPGFVLLFVVVTLLSSWFMTSSPRLSYFGIQVALAFYLINLNEFKMQTSLAVARDRVVGILLGLFIMWLVFDQLWGTRAAVEMRRAFIKNFRLLAQLAREPLSNDLKTATARSLALREMINSNFDKVRALADGVLFEFGPARNQHLALRDRIRQSQPQLRTLFLMRNALWKYRVQLPGFELPEPVRMAQQEFDYQSAKVLDDMADRLEDKTSREKGNFEDSVEQLQRRIRACCSQGPQNSLPAQVQTFLALSRNLESLTKSLSKESEVY